MFLKNKMKILYLSYDGLTDPLGQSQILPYLIHLTKQGFRFTILSFEKRDRFEKEAAIIESIVAAHEITWVPLFFTPKPPVLSKIYDRHQMWRTALRLQQQHSFSLIHCRSYVAAEVGLKLKERFGCKMLFDMRGFWADEKVDNGQWNLKSPLFKWIYQFYKKKEKEFLLKADGIVSLTYAAKEVLLQQPAYSQLSIDVIPCCADLQHFNFEAVSEQTINQKRAALQIPPNAKVITYLGSVGGWYMTKEMFLLFAAIQKQYPNYVMLVLTKDASEKVIQEAVDCGIPANKIYITYASRQELPSYLAMCSASLFFIRNSYSKTASSPTKHAELMGMGIPVICNDIGDTGNIISHTKTGLLIADFSAAAMHKAVNTLPQLEHIDKKHIRTCAKELFDLTAGAEKYYQLYQRILKS